MKPIKLLWLAALGLFLLGVDGPPADDAWTLGPFTRLDRANPVLGPSDHGAFFCPILKQRIAWEDRYVYNPAAIVKDGKVFLIYRAQGSDADGRFDRASRLGLAWSDDGVNFTRAAEPVLYPDRDAMRRYEWPGGCEDPRVVETEDGTYILTYTAFDGAIARLAVASSPDLVHWRKHWLAFGKARGGRYRQLWSKSGAIVTELRDGRPIAKRIDGKYWMYWGDTDVYLATSDDLIDWTPLTDRRERSGPSRFLLKVGAMRLKRLLAVRPGSFDSQLVESGPPPILTDAGIVFIYNSANRDDPALPKGGYAAGQALIDPADPTRVIARTESYFLRPERDFERIGQVDNVVFVEGLVRLRDRDLIYYGAADTFIGAAASALE